MATATIVVTYTPAASDSASASESGISFTVGGTAYASLTAAQIRQALRLFDLCTKQALSDKTGVLTGVGEVTRLTS